MPYHILAQDSRRFNTRAHEQSRASFTGYLLQPDDWTTSETEVQEEFARLLREDAKSN